MEPIVTILGYGITTADVADFVINWLIPAATGLLSMVLTQGMKAWISEQFAALPEGARVAAIRLLVAGCCVVLNVIATYTLGEPLDPAVLPKSFLSYLAAVTAFEHLTRTKTEPSE